MAEIREPKGPLETAGFTIEQVQEWLANPCTIALKARVAEAVKAAQVGIQSRAVEGISLTNVQLGDAIRFAVARFQAAQQLNQILEGADAYASDK
jgi:hypothetical protein